MNFFFVNVITERGISENHQARCWLGTEAPRSESSHMMADGYLIDTDPRLHAFHGVHGPPFY